MVLGVGTDILLIDRMRQASFSLTDAFMKKTYTPGEREQALERDDPTLYFATRFAGKEAVFKALGTDGSVGSFCEIEILNDETGRPYVILHNEIKKAARERNISDIQISLSYDTEYATAFAVAQSGKECTYAI